MNTLSVVIPVYNEEGTLKNCIQRVLDVDIPLKRNFVIVNDASSDGSKDVINEIVAHHCDIDFTVIHHEVNQGKGAALISGFAKVTGDIVIIQDADLEYDPKDYGRLMQPIIDGRADVVYGSRFLGGQEKRVLFFWHSVGNKVLTMVSNICTNLNLTDMETCYKVFNREALSKLKLKSKRFGIEPEMTAKIAKAKFKVYEIGISYNGRTYEEGKKIGWKDGVSAFWTILKYRFIN